MGVIGSFGHVVIRNHFFPLMLYYGVLAIVQMIISEEQDVKGLLPKQWRSYYPPVGPFHDLRTYLIKGLLVITAVLFFEKLMILLGFIQRKKIDNFIIRLIVQGHFFSLTSATLYLYLCESPSFFLFIHHHIIEITPLVLNYQYLVTLFLLGESLILSVVKVILMIKEQNELENLIAKKESERLEKVEKQEKQEKEKQNEQKQEKEKQNEQKHANEKQKEKEEQKSQKKSKKQNQSKGTKKEKPQNQPSKKQKTKQKK